jgi:hypothetical protein
MRAGEERAMTAGPGSVPIVYLGPSLDADEASRLLEADYRPPIRRGDLPYRYDGVIVIIDGEFGQSLSVSPNEILRLLDNGTRVIGAASMGALRAAELYPFGMEGCGWIFDAYRTGRIDADDEVAITFSPDDLRPLTVPLVNVRRWLEQLDAIGQIDAMTARRLHAKARRIFFADRSERRLCLEWEEVVGQTELRRLLSIFREGITDAKAADARVALIAARQAPSEGDRGPRQ